MNLNEATQETTLAKQDACAYKILQDGRFGKIEQEYLSNTCENEQDQCLARLS